MIFLTENLASLFLSIYSIQLEKSNIFLAVLDPTIKTFIWIAAFLGPLSIACLIMLLKRIEKNDPNKIRWR